MHKRLQLYRLLFIKIYVKYFLVYYSLILISMFWILRPYFANFFNARVRSFIIYYTLFKPKVRYINRFPFDIYVRYYYSRN